MYDAAEVVFRQLAQEGDPAAMQRREEIERDGNRERSRIGQFCPLTLVVRVDSRWIRFGDGKFHPHVRIHVTVGHVMHHLPDRPTAQSIAGLELRIRQALHERTEIGRRAFDVVDPVVIDARGPAGERTAGIGRVG